MVRSEGVVLYAPEQTCRRPSSPAAVCRTAVQFGQTGAGLVALLDRLTELQEVFDYLLGYRTDRYRPWAELVSVVGENFWCSGGMFTPYQRITLPGLPPAVAGYAAAVVEHLH